MRLMAPDRIVTEQIIRFKSIWKKDLTQPSGMVISLHQMSMIIHHYAAKAFYLQRLKRNHELLLMALESLIFFAYVKSYDSAAVEYCVFRNDWGYQKKVKKVSTLTVNLIPSLCKVASVWNLVSDQQFGNIDSSLSYLHNKPFLMANFYSVE